MPPRKVTVSLDHGSYSHIFPKEAMPDGIQVRGVNLQEQQRYKVAEAPPLLKQNDDVEEYVSSWMTLQKNLLEDLLSELLPNQKIPLPPSWETTERESKAMRVSDPPAWPRGSATRGVSAASRRSARNRFFLPKVPECPVCAQIFGMGRCERCMRLSTKSLGTPKGPFLTTVREKNDAGMTWNLDDEMEKQRIVQGNQRASLERVMGQISMCPSDSDPVVGLASRDIPPSCNGFEVEGPLQSHPYDLRVTSNNTQLRNSLNSEELQKELEKVEEKFKSMANKNHQAFFYGKTRLSQMPRSLVHQLVKSHCFDQVVCFLVVLSSLMVGVEVQLCAVQQVQLPPYWLQVLQAAFTCFFALELFLRGCVWKQYFMYFLRLERSSQRDELKKSSDWHWNVFDIAVVVLSLIDMVVGWVSEEGNPILAVSNVVRIIRMVRIIRVVRFLQLRELKLMIFSIFHTLKSLIWSLVLMMVMMYVFSAYMTQATTSHLLAPDHQPHQLEDKLQQYWSSMPKAAYTLFMCMSGGISWGDPVEALSVMHWNVMVVFLVYICFMLFAFLNVITGFFCVSASDLANGVDREIIIQEQLKNKEKYMETFRDIFKMMDVDGNGDISLQELEANFEDDDVRAYFRHLNLDIDKAWDIFKILDSDGSGTLNREEFVSGCLRLRGYAKSIDVAGLGRELKRLGGTLTNFMHFVEKSLEEICKVVRVEGVKLPRCPREVKTQVIHDPVL